MTSINRQWALNRLEAFLTTIEIRYSPSPQNVIGPGSYRLLRNVADVQTAAQVAEQILDRVLPEWRTADWHEPKRPAQPWWRHREAARRAIAQLEADQELHDNLGDSAPQLSASTFHPWVWDSARTLWSSGHYREAVGAAARAINAQAQTKLNRRDASDGNLLSDAFSVNAPLAGHPRFRLMPDDASETFRSLHNGAANFARGAYSAIRNPTAHEEGELEEYVALEQLAVFSVLARWVDAANVDR